MMRRCAQCIINQLQSNQFPVFGTHLGNQPALSNKSVQGVPRYTTKDYGMQYNSHVDMGCRDTMKDFKNSPAGREVLKAAMTQLLLYYTRLLELLRRSGGDGVALARDAVTVQSIMYEIKRYNRT